MSILIAGSLCIVYLVTSTYPKSLRPVTPNSALNDVIYYYRTFSWSCPAVSLAEREPSGWSTACDRVVPRGGRPLLQSPCVLHTSPSGQPAPRGTPARSPSPSRHEFELRRVTRRNTSPGTKTAEAAAATVTAAPGLARPCRDEVLPRVLNSTGGGT